MLAARTVSLKILDFNLDTSIPMGEMVLGVLAYVAQFECKLLLGRQKIGIAKAKPDGKFKGRPKNKELLNAWMPKSLLTIVMILNLSIKLISEKSSISQGDLYQKMKKVVPEKIRHRTSKQDIINNVFDGETILYRSAPRTKKAEICKICEEKRKLKRDPFPTPRSAASLLQNNIYSLNYSHGIVSFQILFTH